MRTLRLSLAGTVILALLGGLDGVVVAHDEGTAPVEPVAVTVSQTSEDVQSFGTTVEADGIHWSEGPWWKIAWEASDPRLSGEGTWSANVNESIATELGIGATTYVLVNPDGRWVGSGHSFTTETREHEVVVLHGEGAYDGLTAALSRLPLDPGDLPTFEGIIFPGDAPTIPEPVEPPTD